MNPKSPHLSGASRAGFGCMMLGLGLVSLHAQENARPATDANRSDTSALSTSPAVAPDQARRAVERFLVKAHASGMQELKLSQLAVTKAANPQVRSYAQEIVNGHEPMARELKTLMTGAGLDAASMDGSATITGAGMSAPSAKRSATAGTSDATLVGSADSTRTPGYVATTGEEDTTKGVRDRWSRMLSERKYKKLTEKSGAEFDQTYINYMVDEHEKDMDLFQDASDDGNPEIQAFAAKYLPTLRRHLEQAEQLDKTLK